MDTMREDFPPGQTAEAADRIRARRTACDDSEMLPDDPAGVARYVRTHRKVPAAVLVADMRDALLIRRALREENDREDLGAIKAARACGITWAQIAEVWGFRGRQGARELMVRLAAATGPGYQRASAPRSYHAAHVSKAGWEARHAEEIRQLAAAAVSASTLPAELADTTNALAEVLEDPEATTTTLMGWLSTLCYDGRSLTPPLCHPATDRAAELVGAWQALR